MCRDWGNTSACAHRVMIDDGNLSERVPTSNSELGNHIQTAESMPGNCNTIIYAKSNRLRIIPVFMLCFLLLSLRGGLIPVHHRTVKL